MREVTFLRARIRHRRHFTRADARRAPGGHRDGPRGRLGDRPPDDVPARAARRAEQPSRTGTTWADSVRTSASLVHYAVDAAATPILLVHGIVDNHTIFSPLERALRRRGFTDLSSFDYGVLTSDVRADRPGPGRRDREADGRVRLREGARDRTQPRRSDHPLLRPADGRSRAGAHRRHPRHAAPGHGAGPGRIGAPPDPPAAPRLRPDRRARASRHPTATPASSPSTATSTS